jgi:hypothetical protein
VLTGGRPHLMAWVSSDGMGDAWVGYNIAAEHNAGLTAAQAEFQFCPAFANGTSTWLESTCYTSIMSIPPASGSQAPRALVCYDRMGTEPPVAPAECQPEHVFTFCMQLTFNTRINSLKHTQTDHADTVRMAAHPQSRNIAATVGTAARAQGVGAPSAL